MCHIHLFTKKSVHVAVHVPIQYALYSIVTEHSNFKTNKNGEKRFKNKSFKFNFIYPWPSYCKVRTKNTILGELKEGRTKPNGTCIIYRYLAQKLWRFRNIPTAQYTQLDCYSCSYALKLCRLFSLKAFWPRMLFRTHFNSFLEACGWIKWTVHNFINFVLLEIGWRLSFAILVNHFLSIFGGQNFWYILKKWTLRHL